MFITFYSILYLVIARFNGSLYVYLYFFVQVSVKIAGANFNVQFEPEKNPTSVMATRLCTEATQRGLVNYNECLEPVTLYLNNVVNEWALDKTLQVPLTLDGNTFDVKFMPELQSATNMANQLCQQHLTASGMGMDKAAACVGPVTSYLQNSINSWVAEKTLEVSVPIDGKVFDVTFLPERQSASDMASKLCINNAATLGVTQATLPNCLGAVTEFLQNSVNRWVQSKTVTIDINVNQKPFTLRFMPERVTAGEMARRLCVEQAADLGLNQQNIASQCIAPITDELTARIDRWIQAKTLVVPLTIGGVAHRISMLPEHDKVARVARTFCVGQAEALGLTEVNIAQQCVVPVADLLQREATAWTAQRRTAA